MPRDVTSLLIGKPYSKFPGGGTKNHSADSDSLSSGADASGHALIGSSHSSAGYLTATASRLNNSYNGHVTDISQSSTSRNRSRQGIKSQQRRAAIVGPPAARATGLRTFSSTGRAAAASAARQRTPGSSSRHSHEIQRQPFAAAPFATSSTIHEVIRMGAYHSPVPGRPGGDVLDNECDPAAAAAVVPPAAAAAIHCGGFHSPVPGRPPAPSGVAPAAAAGLQCLTPAPGLDSPIRLAGIPAQAASPPPPAAAAAAGAGAGAGEQRDHYNAAPVPNDYPSLIMVTSSGSSSTFQQAAAAAAASASPPSSPPTPPALLAAAATAPSLTSTLPDQQNDTAVVDCSAASFSYNLTDSSSTSTWDNNTYLTNADVPAAQQQQQQHALTVPAAAAVKMPAAALRAGVAADVGGDDDQLDLSFDGGIKQVNSCSSIAWSSNLSFSEPEQSPLAGSSGTWQQQQPQQLSPQAGAAAVPRSPPNQRFNNQDGHHQQQQQYGLSINIPDSAAYQWPSFPPNPNPINPTAAAQVNQHPLAAAGAPNFPNPYASPHLPQQQQQQQHDGQYYTNGFHSQSGNSSNGNARYPTQPPLPPPLPPAAAAAAGAPLQDPRSKTGPLPGLRIRLSKVALLLFVLYMVATGVYLVIRLLDIFRLLPTWGLRGYSLAILAVELIGISALVPYAFANVRSVLPIKEDDQPVLKKAAQTLSDAEVADSWKRFGCHSTFDVFVIIPCYKEEWSTIKRTLMCAMFARVPPGCRKHIILGNDGHDVPASDPAHASCAARHGLVADLQADLMRLHNNQQYGPSFIDPSAPPWWYDWWFDIWVSCRPKLRQDHQQPPENLTGRNRRIPGNGKSLNLNYCIKTMIPRILARYHIQQAGDPGNPKLSDVSDTVLHSSVVVVLDCDMAIKNDANEHSEGRKPPKNGDGLGFFPKILRILEDPRVDLVLTPQTFTNVSQYADVFNHLNPQFWEYILPGLTALGYVACTGTNMGLRLSMLHQHSSTNDRDPLRAIKPFAKGQGAASALLEASLQGPFPTYSVTEDYALSLELKKAGFKGTYHAEYLVCGEAPHGISKVDVQRGRWTEGHWQIFFSKRNPWLSPFKLGLVGMLYYNYGTLAYLCNIVTIWVYQFVPLLSALNIQPVAFSEQFRYAATVYLLSTMGVQYYVREASHTFGMWRANMSNVLLSWTYTKAILRAMIRIKSGFATHTAASEVPVHETQAQPEMPEPPPQSLVQESVPEVIGHLLYFGLLGLLSGTTILICLLQTIRERRLQSRFLLPAAWAVYNAVGPLLFFLSAGLRRSKSLEMGVEMLRTIHNFMGLTALVSMWFINSRLTIGLASETTGQDFG